MKVAQPQARMFLFLAVSHFQAAAVLAGIPGASLQEMLDAHPALRAFYDGERLSAIGGCPLAGDSDPVTTTEAFVQAFLAEHSDIFGVEGLEVSPAKEVTLSSGKRVFTFVQEMTMPGEGPIPVHGGILKLVVQPGSTEYIAYAGLRLVSRPGDPLPADVITPGEAVSVVAGNPAYQHLSTFGSPDRVIYEDEIGVVHRVYRFHGSGAREAYLFFVDTASAELVGVESQVYDAGISACILGHATPGTAAGGPAEEPVPLPGVQVSVNGDEFFSDAQTGCFNYAIPPGQSLTVTSSLVSEWVRVENAAGPNLTVTAGPFWYPNYDIEMIFNDPTTVPRDQATAQVNAFLAIKKTSDLFRGLSSEFATESEQITAITNEMVICNAFFKAPSTILFGSAVPGQCANAAFSTIASHEYGHYIVYKLVDHGSVTGSFHEGVADAVAAYVWETPQSALGWLSPGVALRDLEANRVCFQNCSGQRPPDCVCDQEHCEGQALGGALWEMRKNLIATHGASVGAQIANQLLADFLGVTRGQWDVSLLTDMLVADDDNGDLSDGTPNELDIRRAFEGDFNNPVEYPGHGWVQSFGDIVVSWTGPPVAPVLGLDYTVSTQVEPPNVTLLTTRKGDAPVEKWVIGREPPPPVCTSNRLGTITTSWQPPSNANIEVFVGTEPGAPVGAAGLMDIPRQSTENWSSIVLNMNSGGYSSARCQAAEASRLGGGVSGSVPVGGILTRAETVRVGETGPASLYARALFGENTWAMLQAGSHVAADYLLDSLLISGDVLGEIEIGSTYLSGIFPLGGRIRVSGNVEPSGQIRITGGPGGRGFSGGRINVVGTMAGTIEVARMEVNPSRVSPVLAIGSLIGTVQIYEDQVGLVRIQSGSGALSVEGSVTGNIEVAGDFSGSLRADADEDGVGDITGNVTINGLFSGGICGANLVQPAPLPSNIQIPDFSCAGTVCGQPPVCSTGVTVTGVGSRYLKITPTVAGGCARAWAINGFAGSFGTDTSCVAGFVDPATRRRISSPAGQSTQRWGEIYVTGEEFVPLGGYSVRGASCDGTPLGDSGSAFLWAWADATNDGIVEIGDVLCILAVYADRDFTEGNCSFYSANIAPCDIDDMVEMSDLLAVLAAYSNPANPCPPPCGSSAMGGEEGFAFDGGESLGGFGGGFTFNSVWVSAAAPTTIPPGGTVAVRAFVYGPEDLRGYQVGLQVSGGTAGSLTVESLNVETARNDFVYYEMDPVVATNLSDARLAAAPFEGSAYVGEENMYLGRFILRASNDAAGTFTVQVRASDTTLRNSDNEALDYLNGSSMQVTIDDP
jgi:hypothetical protein